MTQPIAQLEGMLVFCKIQEPTDCYEKSKGQEWKCGIVVDEDTADAWDAIYPKQGSKIIKTSDFESIYKTAPPDAFSSEKKQYVITLKKNTKLGNGNPVPEIYQPTVLLEQGEEAVDITQTQLVGNGSMGYMSVDNWESPKGWVARLKNVLVTELVPYNKTEGSNYVKGDEFAKRVKAEVAPSKPVAKAVVKKVRPQADDTDESDFPPF